MSTSQTRTTHTRSSTDGLKSILVLTSTCMLVLAACGGDDAAIPSSVGVAGSGAAGGGAVTPTPSAGGGAGGPAAGGAGRAGAAGGGATGRAGAAAPSGGAGSSATPTAGSGTGAAGAGTAGAPAPTEGEGEGEGAAGAPPTSEGGGPDMSNCLFDQEVDYAAEGPYQFMAMSGQINFWVPMVPAGCKVPVIHLANGTGASCSSYQQALERFASHGFLTTCYESANTGSGAEGLEALQASQTMFPDLADKKFGSTGHSQGGQAAFIVLQFAEDEFGVGPDTKFAGLAMQPASGFGNQPAGGSWQSIYAKIKSPMFMFSGQGSDGLVSQGWVQDAFDNLDPGIEAYHWAKAGGNHIPTPQGEEMQIGPAWFRWKLLGDQKACAYFKAIPTSDTTWEEAAVQNAAECQ